MSLNFSLFSLKLFQDLLFACLLFATLNLSEGENEGRTVNVGREEEQQSLLTKLDFLRIFS